MREEGSVVLSLPPSLQAGSRRAPSFLSPCLCFSASVCLRQSLPFSLPPLPHPPPSFFLCPSLPPCICSSASVCLSPSIFLDGSAPRGGGFYLWISLSLSPSLLFVSLSLYLSVSPSLLLLSCALGRERPDKGEHVDGGNGWRSHHLLP